MCIVSINGWLPCVSSADGRSESDHNDVWIHCQVLCNLAKRGYTEHMVVWISYPTVMIPVQARFSLLARESQNGSPGLADEASKPAPRLLVYYYLSMYILVVAIYRECISVIIT
jgi:hypothetical protein